MKTIKSFTRTRTLYILVTVSFSLLLAAAFTARPNLAKRHHSSNSLVRSLNTTPPLILNSPTITVDSLGDSISGLCPTGGPGEYCTLREAIMIANASGGGTINFAPTLSGTILLSDNLPPISADTSINGPGASVLTVNGRNASRVFQVSSNVTVTLAGLTIADANPGPRPPFLNPFIDGGGIYNEGQLLVKDCVVSGNSAPLSGGGIYNAPTGNLTVINSTITGNHAEGGGGGISNWATLKVINTTISNNSVWNGAGGGIASIGGGSSVEIYNSTIFQNSSGMLGGGLANSAGSASVLNSIIADNSAAWWDPFGLEDAGKDCWGVVNSLGHNLIQVIDSPCSITGITTGNITGVSPMLGPLKNNGGGTLTHALLPGSPAIDAGDDSVTGTPLNLNTDQRGDGFARKLGDHVDIGAYEAATSCLNPPTNMLAWFTGDDNALDSKGSNHGILMDAVTYETGEVANAFRFPGDASNPAIKSIAAVRLPMGALHQPYGALTIDAWIYPTAHGHDTSGLFVYPTGYHTSGRYGLTIFSNTDGGGYALRIKDGFLQADLRTQGLGVFQNFTQRQVPLNAWSHVAMTYDGSLVRMYLNGQLLGTAPAGGGISTSGNENTCPMIGNEPDGCHVQASGLNQPIGAGFVGGFGFQGRVDELEFFNRALSSSEIQAIVSASDLGKCKIDSEDGLPVGLRLEKTAIPIMYRDEGEVITYTYTITNTSAVATLPGPFFVSDNKIANGARFRCFNGPLGPGLSDSCNSLYNVVQSDIDDGSITNRATAFGSGFSSNTARLQLWAIRNPSLEVVKTLVPPLANFDHKSQELTYRYTVTNMGNVTLQSPFEVNDDHAYVPPGPQDRLAPKQFRVFTGSYVTKQEDLDNGGVRNTVVATAKTVKGETVAATDWLWVRADQNPAIELEKSATPNSFRAAGQVIQYKYIIKNTGNVTLPGPFTVTDVKTSPIPFNCGVGPVAPDAPTSCLKDYTITNDDVTAGSVTNDATVATVFNGQALSDNENLTILFSTCIQPPFKDFYMKAWWPGDGNANDLKGGSPGELIGGAGYAPGQVDQAFSFSGGGSAVRVPKGPPIYQPILNSYLTVDAWIYPTAYGHNESWVADSGLYGLTIFSNIDGSGYALRVFDGYLQADLRTDGAGGRKLFTAKKVPLNQWSHVAMTYDTRNVRMYLNGELIGEQPVTGAITTWYNASTCPMIGNEPEGCRVQVAGFGWQGLIDEVEVWYGLPLSRDAIKSIYDAGTGGKCK